MNKWGKGLTTVITVIAILRSGNANAMSGFGHKGLMGH